MSMKLEVIIPSFREYLDRHAKQLNITGINSLGKCRWNQGPEFRVEGNTVTLESTEASPNLEWLRKLVALYDDYIGPLPDNTRIVTVKVRYTAIHRKLSDQL